MTIAAVERLPGFASGVWPRTTRLDPGGQITVGGLPLEHLARRFSTPAYILDESDVRYRCRSYRSALPEAEIAYAGKAFLCRALASWLREEGLSLDACSEGEIAVARVAGFPADKILLHGNAKTPGDLRAAAAYRVGRVVIDSLPEITRLAALTPRRQDVLVRVTPGVDVAVHHAVAAGAEDQKLGFPLSSGAAAEAVAAVVRRPELNLVGLHCHLGSQLAGLGEYDVAARRLLALLAAVRAEHGPTLRELNLGGGHAVPYADGDPEFDLPGFAVRIAAVIRDECASLRLPVPRLTVEPGRAIISRAMVALYRVIAVREAPGGRTFVAVDGGMSDNPRPVLYGARYSMCLTRQSAAPARPVTVAGRHCEPGDVLARDVPLPADTRPGDLIAVPGAGAYTQSMASNYNLVGRPPVIAVRDGSARVLLRRETHRDLLRRDVGAG
jgi:diaminopimelate decarboxylase